MKYLALLLLTGCAINYPVWVGDEGLAHMCERPGEYQYTHMGETKTFNLHFVADLPKSCEDAGAYRGCIINRQDIYLTNGNTVTCTTTLAHELSHGFGMDFVDRHHVPLSVKDI